MSGKRMVLFELNEVPLRIFDHYAKANPASSIARLMNQGRTYRSVSEDVGDLSPWKTWPSVHRGVSDDKHMIGDFGQPLEDVDQAYPPIWHLLARHGVKVGMGGSLHSYPLPQDLSNYRFYIPDIFAAGSECLPESLNDFQSLCLNMARESSKNVARGFPIKEAANVLLQSSALGIKPATYGRLASQVIEERFSRWKVTRRRTFQAVLAFDVFMKQFESTRPEFTTFFTNHVASAMHRYWAAAFPEDYPNPKFPQDWVSTFNEEIDYAMGEADRMLGRMLRFMDLNPDYRLVVATSMGQEAIDSEPLELQVYIDDPLKFFQRLGFGATSWTKRAAMFPQFNLVAGADHADELEAQLRKLRIGGDLVGFRRGPDGFFSIDFGHRNQPDCRVNFDGQEDTLKNWGLFNLEIADKSNCSAYHIHEGTLVVYGAGIKPTQTRAETSSLDICPALLANYGVAVPAYMKGSADLLTA